MIDCTQNSHFRDNYTVHHVHQHDFTNPLKNKWNYVCFLTATMFHTAPVAKSDSGPGGVLPPPRVQPWISGSLKVIESLPMKIEGAMAKRCPKNLFSHVPSWWLSNPAEKYGTLLFGDHHLYRFETTHDGEKTSWWTKHGKSPNQYLENTVKSELKPPTNYVSIYIFFVLRFIIFPVVNPHF